MPVSGIAASKEAEVVAVALEQREIERGLVGEVAVQDGLGDPRRRGDLVEARAVVACSANSLPAASTISRRRSGGGSRLRLAAVVPEG